MTIIEHFLLSKVSQKIFMHIKEKQMENSENLENFFVVYGNEIEASESKLNLSDEVNKLMDI